MRKIFLIFILSFLLNLIWENLHSYLYTSYMGQKITEAILLRASFVDAWIITMVAIPFFYIAFFIELYAMNTGRWLYNGYMPIIPLLNIGITPTIQLGLLGYLSYIIVSKITNRPTS